MRRLLVAAVLIILASGTLASAQDTPPISPAQLQKLLKFIDVIGAKQEFPAPTALSLGVSDDPSKVLPVLAVVTDDHKVYFCRSQLDPADYIIWSRTEDKNRPISSAPAPTSTWSALCTCATDSFPRQSTATPPRSRPSIKAPWRRWLKTSTRVRRTSRRMSGQHSLPRPNTPRISCGDEYFGIPFRP